MTTTSQHGSAPLAVGVLTERCDGGGRSGLLLLAVGLAVTAAATHAHGRRTGAGLPPEDRPELVERARPERTPR